ncbi:hypothetical protein GCM10019016_104000 [Streptomyces prasinosporus]|uniref:Uncharacterized protein n=1 Tax=Streptomyces prasinosporus TaxID=68256 RepID=A0ABP6U6J9_9ACTN
MLPLPLPHPVAALATERPDDFAVADAVVRLAAPREAPVLPVAVPPHQQRIPHRSRVDAHSLIGASAVRGGPFVHAVAPTRSTVPVAGAGPGPADLSPAGALRGVRTLAQRACPPPGRWLGGAMDSLAALAPGWLPALVDPAVGGLCIALAMRPHRRSTTRRPA